MLGLALFFLGFGLVWHTSHRVPIGLRNPNSSDVWFEADVSRLFFNEFARHSDQTRSHVHPLYALVAYPACTTFHRLLGLDFNESADLFLALTAGAWMVLMYVVLCRLGFDRALATVAAVMGIFTTSGLLFFSVPETYGLSSVSILLAIALLLFTDGTTTAGFGALLTSASSLSITVTNWSLGLLLTARRYWFRRWLQLSINAFFVITVLWSVERAMMPSAEFFTAVATERQFVHRVTSAVVVHTACVFAFHTVVTPAVNQVTSFGPEEYPIGPGWKTGLSLQSAWPGAGSNLGIVVAVLWLAVLSLGVMTLARDKAGPIALPILAFLILQFCLHVLYGVETILYSLDWMPVLVIVAAYGFHRLGRGRWPAILLFTLLLAVNNFAQFDRIVRLVRSYQQALPLSPPESPEQMLPPG